MKSFLKRKEVVISMKKYGTESLSFMALGLFSTLIIGLIFNQLGELLSFQAFLKLGSTATALSGAGIGISVAYSLKAPPLVLFSTLIGGALGYEYGGPIGAFVSSIFASEIGKLISKETKVDIIITPMVTIITGGLVAYYLGAPISALMTFISTFIERATELMPLVMGMAIGASIGMILTLPISSAGICISLGISGLSAGAACAGCCAQMVGFAVASYKENGINGLLSQGIGTSMLQISNIVKNPKIWIAPTIASAICGGLSTTVFKMTNTAYGAGMGTAGLVGQFGTLEAMGNTPQVIFKILILQIILPAIITLFISSVLRKKGYIKLNDMKI
ncbi:MAG: PTS transporter subunit IIC [Lachnospirales bacterium]